MKSNTKAIIVIAAILIVLFTGRRIVSSFRRPAQPTQAMNPYGVVGQPMTANLDMTQAAESQAALYELMNKRQMGMKAANFISQAKLQVLDQTDTSVHFVITFSNQTKIDETFTVTADPGYRPTSADIQRAAKTGSNVYGATLTHKKTGAKSWTYTLQYHVPYSALPDAIRQKIKAASSRDPGASDFFNLVPRAYASEPVLSAQDSGWPTAPNSQAGVTGFGTIAAVANVVAESTKDYRVVEGMLEEFETAKSLGADVPLAMVDALEDYLTFNNWMHELDEMENCAKNPTNPLAQKALDSDPNYQHDVLDQMNDAKDEVKWARAPMIASDVAGYVSHFLPFGGGVVTTLVFSTQDEAVNQYVESRIDDARRNYTPCKDERPALGGGSFEFTYKRTSSVPGNQQQEDVRVEGNFQFKQDPHGFPTYFGQGEATVESNEKDSTYTNQSHTHFSGPLKVEVNGRGMPRDATLEVNFDGDNLRWLYSCSGRCNSSNRDYSTNKSHRYNRGCMFNGVDMVRGGTFTGEAVSDHTGAQTICTLKLAGE